MNEKNPLEHQPPDSLTPDTDLSEAEAIRHLLADIPNRTEKGTVLFTKGTAKVKSLKRTWRGVASTIIVLALAILGFSAYVRQQLSPVSPGVSAPSEFEILSGWGANTIAQQLEQKGFIRNARLFSFYLRQQKLDRNIGEGLYDLDPAMSAADITSVLNQGGRPRVTRVTIPEGFRLKDIARTLAQAGFADEQSFLDLFQSPGDLAPELLAGQSLEGYLFPASYDIPVKSTPQDILQLFLSRFEQEVTPEVSAWLTENGWSIPQWVTLASMVQAEAADASEMPIITGVFLNRLEQGMLLQSDPTVAYGLGKDLPELNYPAGDFAQDHPWNTYVHSGLPQTPINNPGHEALQAILHPQRNNEAGQPYVYFLHGLDNGQKVFRPNINLDDHNRDVAQYLR